MITTRASAPALVTNLGDARLIRARASGLAVRSGEATELGPTGRTVVNGSNGLTTRLACPAIGYEADAVLGSHLLALHLLAHLVLVHLLLGLGALHGAAAADAEA